MTATTAPSGVPLTHASLEGGRVRALRLARPKANVLDARMIEALRVAFLEAQSDPHVHAVVLGAEGPHFSFGASVEEHLPGREAAMLGALHGLLRTIASSDLPFLAAVQGQCLGGALEVLLLAQRITAAPDARLGQPEITLGVFAPAASVLLPERVGRPMAEDLLLTGRSLGADEALRVGLVDAVAADPWGEALGWARAHLVGKSASSLRLAVRASRVGLLARLEQGLEEVERLYLDRLMSTADAAEGLTAFLAKREPAWRDA